jgi:hypothetical protein
LKSTPVESFYDSPVFERLEQTRGPGEPPPPRDALPQRYALRLGKPFLPAHEIHHRAFADALGYLLRADTHDAHIQPRAGSREMAAFAELMRQNRAIADAIEGKWETLGLPTFKKFLREDLERRRAAAEK